MRSTRAQEFEGLQMSEKARQPIHMVERSELPLSCPRPGDEVWNMHPRVYMPLEKEKRCECPYCGAVYELKE